jgi:uncharacterized protein YccT (UPF0319 family)
MTTSRDLASAYQLARDRIFKETGQTIYKRADILKAVESATGMPAPEDVREYLLEYARQKQSNAASTRRAYTPDRSMTIAAKRAASHPELMSMNSNIKFWNNDYD